VRLVNIVLGYMGSGETMDEKRPELMPTPLSIVVATIKPWPEARRCLDALQNQARLVEAEIIVADGHGNGLPDDVADSYPEVIWLRKPGGSVFYLRGLAMAKATGEIVAVTEDHCEVSQGWCERIIKAHKEHPDAAAIGGAVENGATTRRIDWANFLLGFGPFTQPIKNGEQDRISLQANISYKRRVIPRVIPQLGMMEVFFNRHLRERGEKLLADEELLVYHIQSWSFFGTFAAHFHNGRSIAGFRIQDMKWPERILRLGGCFILPPYLLWRTIWPICVKRRLLGHALACLHLLALLASCQAIGEFVGYLAGPGGSPQRVA
jgi:hypothetical protein